MRWASVVAVLPRPMSSARQPPSPTRARNCIQAEPAPLVVAQLAVERRRLVHLLEPLVGQPGEQRRDPVRGRRRIGPATSRHRATRSTARVGRRATRRPTAGAGRRRRRATCVARWSSSSARARRRPSGSMRTQRCPVRISVVPAASIRARSASDSGVSSTTAFHSTSASLPNRPLRSSAGASRAVPRTPTRARTRCSGPSSSIPSRSQLGRGDVEEVVGLIDVELDRAGLVLGREVGEGGNVRRDQRGECEHLDLECADPCLAARHLDGARRRAPTRRRRCTSCPGRRRRRARGRRAMDRGRRRAG